MDSTVGLPLRERRGAIAEAVRRLDRAGVAADDLTVESPTLDDVFLRLTGHAAEDDSKGERLTDARGRRSPTRSCSPSGACCGFRGSQTCSSASRSSRSCLCCSSSYVFGGAISTPGLRLRRLPDPGNHRSVDDLRRLPDGTRSRRGSEEGPDRPFPVAPDVPGRGAHGPDACRRRDERAPGRRDAGPSALRSAFGSRRARRASSRESSYCS